jgi:hypothetical protein
MLKKHSPDFAKPVVNEFTDFLRLPGVQHHGADRPSDVQCADVAAKTDRDTQDYVEPTFGGVKFKSGELCGMLRNIDSRGSALESRAVTLEGDVGSDNG